MNSKWTFNKILERFEHIEKKLCLDEAVIQGVPWWDMLRQTIFEELLFELIEKEEIKNRIFLNNEFKKKKILTIFRVLKNLINIFSPKSPLWINKRSVMILGHPQRKFEKGKYVDPYTDPFIDLFPKTIDFSVIERPVENFGHFSPVKTKNLFYADSLYEFSNIISIFRKLKFRQSDLLTITNLEKTLHNEFSCLIDVNKRVKKIVYHWLGYYPLMRFFFKLKKPKLLFVVVSEGHEAIIAAAKSLSITTIELQHGSPARGKLIYDYTSGIKKKSSTDLLLSFGDFWSSNCKFSLDKDKIIPFGNSYLHMKFNSYSHIIKEDRLVVISQGNRVLAKFALDIYKEFSKKIIVEYKPHPREFNEQEPDYFTELRNAGVVISHKHADLYEILAKSRWQVGIYSTTLYEGLYFGTACFVVNSTRAFHMKRLIELDFARLISSPKDIDLNWKIEKKDMETFFSKPSQKNIEYVISLFK